MKLVDMLLIGGLAYLVLSPKVASSAQQSESSQATTSLAAIGPFHTTELNNLFTAGRLSPGYNARLSTPIVSSTGHIIATDIFKGRASINQTAQIANILHREGPATGITLTGNPLEVIYTLAGGSTATSSRRPSSDAEVSAARAANIKALGGVRDSRTGELLGA